MADVVRLSIVYDTGQAAAQLAALNTKGAQLDITTNRVSQAAGNAGTKLRGMAVAGSHLANALATGNLSARTLAASVAHLAGPAAFAGLAVTVLSVIEAFKEYNKIVRDVEDTIDSMQNRARDARADVARLLGEQPQESNAEKAVRRLRDAVRDMRKEATRLGGAAGEEINRQADILELQVKGVGKRAHAQDLRDAANAEQAYNRQLGRTDEILVALNAGPMERLQAHLALQRKRYEELIEKGLSPASEKARQMADEINFGAAALANMKRKAALFEDALFTMSDAVEEFVLTGTVAFTDFLNNILRLLYRDAASQLIGGLVSQASGFGGKGTVEPGKPTGGKVLPSVVSNVNITVTAIDAQGVSAFLHQNGPEIAAIVGGHAERSRGLRKQLTRG